MRLSALQVSLLLHFGVALAFVILQLALRLNLSRAPVEIEVYQYPKLAAAPALKTVTEVKKEEPKPPEKKAVFGLHRKAITTNDSAATTEVKSGNTVAKENDDLKLKEDDPDAIPLPTDDYLVSTMPKLLTEVRIPYPPEAKSKSIEGPVVMDLLIDSAGKVRSVELISGPGGGLNEAAMEAIKNFVFVPAKVDSKSVAVKIRYTYRFVLEAR